MPRLSRLLRCCSAVVSMLCATALFAQSASEFERFLLPVYFTSQQRGANGAVWSSGFTLLNDSDQLMVQAIDFMPYEPCLFACGQTVPPGTAQNINFLLPTPQPIPALLMLVRRPFVERIGMALSIQEQSRAERQPARLPVVAEDEFRGDAINLLLVERTSATHRTLLRVYDPDARSGAMVRVRAFELFGGSVVGERVVPLAVSPERYEPSFGGGPVFPGYAQVPLDDSFFVPGLNPRLVFRIRVEPVAPGQRVWAMVSVTHNATNEFTVITPEP